MNPKNRMVEISGPGRIPASVLGRLFQNESGLVNYPQFVHSVWYNYNAQTNTHSLQYEVTADWYEGQHDGKETPANHPRFSFVNDPMEGQR